MDCVRTRHKGSVEDGGDLGDDFKSYEYGEYEYGEEVKAATDLRAPSPVLFLFSLLDALSVRGVER